MEKTNDQISQISIHPLLAERDDAADRLVRAGDISIHPLLAERDRPPAAPLSASDHFNPPAPRGAGPLIQSTVDREYVLFQSTRS